MLICLGKKMAFALLIRKFYTVHTQTQAICGKYVFKNEKKMAGLRPVLPIQFNFQRNMTQGIPKLVPYVSKYRNIMKTVTQILEIW